VLSSFSFNVCQRDSDLLIVWPASILDPLDPLVVLLSTSPLTFPTFFSPPLIHLPDCTTNAPCQGPCNTLPRRAFVGTASTKLSSYFLLFPQNTAWSYHNGGSWPTLLWHFTAACIKGGRPELARRAMDQAEKKLAKLEWPEYFDGVKGK
jgi:hypothetical protein